MSPDERRSELPTREQLEAVFFAALEAGDLKGVMASLQVMAVVDPHRAADLFDDLQTALNIAKSFNAAEPAS